VLSIIDANGGQLEGRTRLQKLAYFVSKDSSNYKIDFNPHYYGPFSSEIDDALQTLVSFGLVEETARTPSLSERSALVFEPKLYSYSLTEKGNAILRSKISKSDAEYKRIQQEIGKIKSRRGGFQTKTLAAASKIDFILSLLKRKASYQEISAEARKLGWNLAPSEIAEVTAFLVQMGYATED
jgi:uncharacterized protein YwgA